MRILPRQKSIQVPKLSNIDRVDGFYLSGWVFDTGNPDYTPVVAVMSEGRVVGEAVANQYRADLLELGFGDGKHGYTIRLSNLVFDGREHQISLIDRDTGIDLGANAYAVCSHANAVIERVDGFCLSGWVFDTGNPDYTPVVAVMSEGKVFGEAVANQYRADLLELGFGDGKHGYTIRLSTSVFDGCEHQISLVDRDTGIDLGANAYTVCSHATAVIDRVDGFYLSGWVFDTGNPDYTPVVSVMSEGKVVGEGVANQHCANLLELGFGDAYHGYAIRLSTLVFDGREHQISLIDRDTGIDLSANAFSVGSQAIADITVDTLGADGISGIIKSRKDQISVKDSVVIYIDDSFAGSATCLSTTVKDEFRFSIALPAKIFDGKPHMFYAAIAGKSVYSVPFFDILPAIQTDWEYLQSSSERTGYASLSKVAGFRYESLRQSMGKVSTIDGLKNLQFAHEVVVKGHMARKRYERLSLPAPQNPVVSVVIPVHNKFELTYLCLASCILAPNDVNWEVIVVDDASSDVTSTIEDIVENVSVVRNPENLGFLHSCNAGAAVARGDYIIFLNNDTEVTSGWLDEMLGVFNRFDRVGAVGSKLVYPDGTLQDAGGIVWDNGLPWNAGHGENAEDPAFNYVREVDYITGASLMVKTEAWSIVGGFCEEYAPAYYEDTHLAFQLREAGFRTFYTPFSTVVHYEGQSNGSDLSSGIKKYQALNAEKFVENWSHAFKGKGTEGKHVALNRDRNRDYRILMIDHAFPCEGQDAGSYAAVQEMKLLMELGCKVTFLPHNFTHLGKYTEELQRLGAECIYAPFYTSINVFLERRGAEFDAVYITRYDVAERVIPDLREFTDAKIIFCNADLHFLREMRAAVANGQTDLSGPKSTRNRELAVMEKVDAVLSYNNTEHTIIASHTMRTDNIFRCPWVLENKLSMVGFGDRKDIAFLGGFGHPPNREAMEYFIRSVMPILRQRASDITLRIYGSNFPDDLSYLESDDVVVEGYVENLATIFDHCRVFIAPLLSGAGVKGKVLDSMAFGVPTVLSPVAAEATGLIAGQSTLIAASDLEWADSIIELYNNPDLWKKFQDASIDIVEREYSQDRSRLLMKRVLDYIGLSQRRGPERHFKGTRTTSIRHNDDA